MNSYLKDGLQVDSRKIDALVTHNTALRIMHSIR